MNLGSMTPAVMIQGEACAPFRAEKRLWQGIPGIERSPQGRLFAGWYSGGRDEEPGNVIVLEISDDDGATWSDGWRIIRHDDPQVRCFDQALWLDPLGRLWVFWAQSHGLHDGRMGVWACVSENPDDAEPVFSAPRRIANGVMLNKPLVTGQGEWLLPCALWTGAYASLCEDHAELDGERLAGVVVSADAGETFTWRGGADVPQRAFDEHMLVELADGRLWMLVRTKYGIGQAFSADGGSTWQDAGPSGHSGPCSRFFARRLRSGRILLVNHVNPTYTTNAKDWNVRNNLMALLSEDDGRTWRGGLMLDTRDEISYPDAVEAPDGTIYVIYDHERYRSREILMSTFTEEDVLAGRAVSGKARYQALVNRAAGER